MTQTDQKNYMKAIKILHLALIIGPTLFLLISIFLVSTGNWHSGLSVYSDGIFLAMAILAAVAVLFSRYNFNKSLHNLRNNGESSEDNGDKYRKALVIRWAIIEFVELFAIIQYLMTGNYYLLILAVALLIYSFTLRPTSEKVLSDLGITIEE